MQGNRGIRDVKSKECRASGSFYIASWRIVWIEGLVEAVQHVMRAISDTVSQAN
jgi:hypothetical protein